MMEEAVESFTRLDRWMEQNGWAGYDPYDLRGHPMILRLLNPGGSQRLIFLAKMALLRFLESFPRASRRVFGIRPRVNAKAMGLLAAAYSNAYQRFGKQAYLTKALECADWLEQNKSQGYAGACWGYPFDWWSPVLLPKHTPSGVVSSMCGDAFWSLYKIAKERRYLEICESICRFFLRDLNMDQVDQHRICFSYTPLDRYHVHNANLFVAEFLIRIGKETGRDELSQAGMKALEYTLDAQNEDGSFYYWALSEQGVYHIPETVLKNIDHYHTGFVLRSLLSIYHNTGDERVLYSLSRGYHFYENNLFKHETIPKLRPNSTYPINIHSCAEAILCMSTLSELFPEAAKYATNALRWTRENMQDRDGHFYYLKTRFGTNKMPYIRWGQAWMMLALATYLTNVADKEKPE